MGLTGTTGDPSGRRLTALASSIARLEPGVVLLAAPLFLFPSLRPALAAGALLALLVVWLARWIGTGRPGARTPLDHSLLVLLLMVPVSVWASAWPELTLPKLTSLILGVAAMRACVNTVHQPRQLAVAIALFLAVGLGLVTIGLAGVSWQVKVAPLGRLLEDVPRLIQGLPGAETGVNANTLGGTVLLFLPVSAAGCLASGVGSRQVTWLLRIGALLLSVFFAVALVLTQSRGAWLAALAGFGVMAWVRWREVRWVLVAALVLLLAVSIAAPQTILEYLFDAAANADAGSVASLSTLEGRLEIWNRALYAIGDFAPTGLGLGAFRRVAPLLYPLFLVPPETDVGHAHNLYLQTALDLGIPGLVGYLALAGTALWLAWRVARTGGEAKDTTGDAYAWLALGVLGALVAYHVHGLIDAAIALGARAGVGLWMLFALAAVLWMGCPEGVTESGESQVAGQPSDEEGR